MAEEIRSADLRRLLAVVDAARSGDAEAGLPDGVLRFARELVDCDIISFNEFDPVRQREYLDQSVPTEEAASGPPQF